MSRSIAQCLFTAGFAVLSGCAQLVVDADGSRHLFGFMSLSLPPITAPGEAGADALRMRTLGLAITRGDIAGGTLVLGYGDTTLAVVRNHSLVPKAALSNPSGQRPEDTP
jgi:hypothetical protein